MRVMDRNGNQLIYTHEGTKNKPTRIEDGLGRRFDITYNTFRNCLETITDQAGRIVRLTCGNIIVGGLSTLAVNSVTDPLGLTTNFHYASFSPWGFEGNATLIAEQTLPRGNTPYRQTYEIKFLNNSDFPRVTSQQDAYGNTTTLTYNPTANIVTAQQPDGISIYEHYSFHGLPKSITDPAGKTWNFVKDADEHITSATDKIGDTSLMNYHAETGMLASATNAKGNTLARTYTAQEQTFSINGEAVTFTFHNLTRIDYPDGTNQQFGCDSKGNVTQMTDRAGKIWRYEYNAMGLATKVTNPVGGVTEYTYYPDGTLATSKDTDTGTTILTYDGYKRLSRMTNPDGSFVEFTYDLNNQVTSVQDENSHTFHYTYDANGNLATLTDPSGATTTYTYDLMDRVQQVADAFWKKTVITYNSVGLHQSVTDPIDVLTGYGYDALRRLNSVTTGGRTWQYGHDDEGIISSFTTPLSYTTAYQNDRLGYLSAITNPLSQTTTFARDTMNRVTAVTDPLNRTIQYAYDSRGLQSGVTVPGIGSATFNWNDLDLLSSIRDLNGNDWSFGYSTTGLLLSGTDPLGNATQFAYDPQGRLVTTSFPGGGTSTRQYDAAGNLTRETFSNGPDLQFTYDASDRLLTANDLVLTRDIKGRITGTENPGTVYGATYDDGDRLATVTYNNNLFTVTYTYYSDTGLLKSITDSLTNAQVDLNYDNDFNLTGITRSNGVNAAFSYDTAGRITRIQEGPSTGPGLIDLQYTLDAAGQVIEASTTAPLDPWDLLAPATSALTYNAGSQVSSAGYTHDNLGRLTASPGPTYQWDGASRLTEISAGSGQVALTYNGMGDLITRTAGGTTTRYHHNYALGLNPIVAERNETAGQYMRYYVYTPIGALLYMIDAADGNKVYFYHFDRVGSTLALTNAAGTVTDAYAYTPYGGVLGHTGSSIQPFTFVGQWGIRQEGGPSTDSGLYQMRARYYNAQTARFISTDPGWPGLDDPLQINPYVYANNNPVSYSDMDGLDVVSASAPDISQSFVDAARSPAPENPMKGVAKPVSWQPKTFERCVNKEVFRTPNISIQRFGPAGNPSSYRVLHYTYGKTTVLKTISGAAVKGIIRFGIAGLAAFVSEAYFRLAFWALDKQGAAIKDAVRRAVEKRLAKEKAEREKEEDLHRIRKEIQKLKELQAERARARARGLNILNVFPNLPKPKTYLGDGVFQDEHLGNREGISKIELRNALGKILPW